VVTLRDLADLVVNANGSGSFAVHEYPADRKRIDIGDYHADWSAIRDDLGWRPKVALAEGLRRMLDFYRDNLADYV
jgi:UDP-glucose 4-epimerase